MDGDGVGWTVFVLCEEKQNCGCMPDGIAIYAFLALLFAALLLALFFLLALIF